jgi:peroxiredoxin
MTKKKNLKINDNAPDFELYDHNKKIFRLSDFESKKVLLSFHPLAWTSVCAQQMLSLEEFKTEFDNVGTIPVGISIDSIPTKKAWSKELGLKNIRLLSDFWPHGQVADYFGIFRDKDGFSERANIIINEEQKIVFFKIYEISKLPDIKEIILYLNKWK